MKNSYINFENKKGSSIEEDVEIATDNVRNHEFFSSINFEELQEGNLESPYKPQVYIFILHIICVYNTEIYILS